MLFPCPPSLLYRLGIPSVPPSPLHPFFLPSAVPFPSEEQFQFSPTLQHRHLWPFDHPSRPRVLVTIFCTGEVKTCLVSLSHLTAGNNCNHLGERPLRH